MLGKKAMIQTDNAYPNTARVYSAQFTGALDMPFDFFMSRYKEAYVSETLAFVDCLVKGTPAPCSGEDGLIALVMAIAAGKSAQEQRWVKCAVACLLPPSRAFSCLLRRDTFSHLLPPSLRFSELAGELASLNSDPMAEAPSEELIDSMTTDTGALQWEKVFKRENSPARVFEKTLAKWYVPSREAYRRPDLAKKAKKATFNSQWK